MSQSAGIQDITFKASEDLSSYQYHFMKLDADGKVAHCTASTDVVIGILQNYPDAEDKAALVRINGTSKLVMSGTNDEGAYITPIRSRSKLCRRVSKYNQCRLYRCYSA